MMSDSDTRARYRITARSGHDYGVYEADSPEAAILAMHRDAGYTGTDAEVIARVEDVLGHAHDRDLVVEEEQPTGDRPTTR